MSYGWADLAHPWPAPSKGLNSREVARRCIHLSPGVLPFILWFVPHPKPWGPILWMVVACISICLLMIGWLKASWFCRRNASDFTQSLWCYAFPILLPLIIFRGYEEIGLMVLTIIALGDGCATLVGLIWGKHPLPWNTRKTYEGTLAFLLAGIPTALFSYWSEAAHRCDLYQAAIVTIPTVVLAALAESLPGPGNDNMRVGVVSVVICSVMTCGGCF